MGKISTPNFDPEKINLKNTISALQNLKKMNSKTKLTKFRSKIKI